MMNLLRWPTDRMRRRQIEELADIDPREVPLYWLSEVALFTGVPASTLKRWVGQISASEAVIQPPPDEYQQQSREARLSFSNLLEAHVLDAARKRDIPIVRMRRGLDYLREQIGPEPHPLLSHEFYAVKGIRDVFVRTLEEGNGAGTPLNISRQGQLALSDVLDEHMKRIEWDRTGPVRLLPVRSEHVVIDLHVSGGKPVIKGTGISAVVLAGRWRAGDSVDDLARGYRLPINDVREAIRYIDAA